MKKRVIIHSLVILSFLLPTAAFGQDDSQNTPYEFLIYDAETGEYSLNFDVLTPAGLVVENPPESWIFPDLEIPIGDTSQLNIGSMVYNKYLTPEGFYVLVPTLYTAIVMAISEEDPFNVEPIGAVVNGWFGAAGYMGWLEGMGYSQEDVMNGDWKFDPGFWIDLVLAINDPNSPLYQGSIFVPPAVLIYGCDPTDPMCAVIMTEGGPVDGSDPTAPPPLPPGSSCAEPSIVQSPIRAEGELLDPPYPVVVGQDNAKRGADLLWRVEIPPVIYTWHETKVVGEEKICSFVGGGDGSGCPLPASQYDRIESVAGIGEVDITTSDWTVTEIPITECIEHIEVYTEQLNWAQTFANLSQESRDWIETGELQQRYPGAKLYQPDWEWTPTLLGEVLGDGTYVWEVVYERIQFQDPGQYSMSIQGGTTGTPVTAARFVDLPAGVFSVWLYEATITQ